MFFLNSYFYYIPVGIQAICAIHCIRKGNQNKWIWVIVFLPVIGSLAYFFTEVYPIRRFSGFNIGDIFTSPAMRVRRLENNLRFTDTFNNRVMLADAYLAVGRVEEAIELYEGSLTGAFEENEHVLIKLIIAYYEQGRYDKVLPLVKKVYNRPQFARSKAHILYALSLERTGETALAEQEFRKMKARFSYFEARYQYGLFLQRAGRKEEARQTFADIVDEAPHLSSRERRDSYTWIRQAKDELRKI